MFFQPDFSSSPTHSQKDSGLWLARCRSFYRRLRLPSRPVLHAMTATATSAMTAPAMTTSCPAPEQEALLSRPLVLVGGGTGFIGAEFCRLLRRKGYRVGIISRSGGGGGGRNSPEPRLTWDEVKERGFVGLPGPDGPNGQTGRLAAVVNLAGQNVLDPLRRWNPQFQQLVYDSRIDTARSVVSAIAKSPAELRPRVFVQVTGIGYYPPVDPDDFTARQTEKSWGGRHDFMARLVADWEAAACVPDEYGVRNVYVRSGVVLGRNGGMIKQLIVPFSLGLGGPSGSGRQPLPWIHVRDLSRLLLHAVERDDVSGPLNGVAPQLVTNSQFTQAFASALWRPAFIPVPEFVWNLVFGEERANMVLKGQRAVPEVALTSGFSFRYGTIEEACKEFAYLLTYPGGDDDEGKKDD